MALFEDFMESCTVINKTHVSDNMGGFVTVWQEGSVFLAAIVKDKTLAAKLAGKEGVSETYIITTKKGLGFDFHDVFKRNSDGAVFRVTSNAKDSETPAAATFQFEQVTAERWALT